jgi:hypothetical protein
MPLPPMRRQWISGAVEAGKKRSWIEACLHEVPVADQRQPLPLRALQDAMREPYTDYASVFLLNSKRAGSVVSETFDVLWMCWLLATGSPNTNRFAWSLLRARVLPRAPRNPDGSINMSMAALFTQAYAAEASCEEHQAQLEESVELFDAISRMPHNPMDTSVLRYLCGLPDDKIPDIIGVTPTLATVFDHHARQILEVDLAARTHPGGITP